MFLHALLSLLAKAFQGWAQPIFPLKVYFSTTSVIPISKSTARILLAFTLHAFGKWSLLPRVLPPFLTMFPPAYKTQFKEVGNKKGRMLIIVEVRHGYTEGNYTILLTLVCLTFSITKS